MPRPPLSEPVHLRPKPTEQIIRLLLRNADIQRVLDMPTTIGALRVGYADLERDDAAYIPRVDLYAPTGDDGNYYRWGSMTGSCRSYGVLATRIRSDIVSWPDARAEGECCGSEGIGADLLARPDARTLGLLGSGGRPRSYLEALAYVRPLEEVRVYSPTRSDCERFAAETNEEVDAVDDAASAVRDADIVAAATDAKGPG